MTLVELRDAADELAELESEVEEATCKISNLGEQCREHLSVSGYGHYCKLQVGLSELYSSLSKLLLEKPKRPRGKIEFLFNNLIESVGGGEFMPEHGGFEQTNGRAMNTLQNFDEIVGQINAKEKPLAIYYFGKSYKNFDRLKEETSSGSLNLNEVVI